MSELTPLNQLAERVMQESKKPCQEIAIHPGSGGWPQNGCPECHGTGTILDTDNVIFKTLWKDALYSFIDFSPKKVLKYIRRSRAEATLGLLRIPYEIRLERRADGWWAAVRMEQQSIDTCGEGETPEDALAAAILAKLKS